MPENRASANGKKEKKKIDRPENRDGFQEISVRFSYLRTS